jgi:hypothetical protein
MISAGLSWSKMVVVVSLKEEEAIKIITVVPKVVVFLRSLGCLEVLPC